MTVLAFVPASKVLIAAAFVVAPPRFRVDPLPWVQAPVPPNVPEMVTVPLLVAVPELVTVTAPAEEVTAPLINVVPVPTVRVPVIATPTVVVQLAVPDMVTSALTLVTAQVFVPLVDNNKVEYVTTLQVWVVPL